MKNIEILYSPPPANLAAVDRAMAQVLQQQQKSTWSYHYYPNKSAGSVVISNDIPKDALAKGARLRITLEPGRLPHNASDFCTNGGTALIEPFLGTVRRAISTCLGTLEQPISPLELADLKVLRVGIEVQFLADTPSDAAVHFTNLVHHMKATMDFPSPMSSSKWKLPRKSLTKVLWSSANRYVLEVALSFGKARVYIAGDGDHYYRGYLNTPDDTARAERLSTLRRLICIEIEANISSVKDPVDPSALLSSSLERWVPGGKNKNPYEFIWNAFTWESWLNIDLATDETQLENLLLEDNQHEVLRCYVRGEVVREHEAINSDYEKFLNFRRALILKAGVDLLNPWRFFRLNLATSLRTTINFENRLLPSKSVFDEATLTAEVASMVGQALDADETPGRGVLR